MPKPHEVSRPHHVQHHEVQEEVYILMHFIFWMCSVRVNAALDSQRLERDL